MDNLDGGNGNEPIKQIGPGKKRFSDTMMFFIVLGIVFLTALVILISLGAGGPKNKKEEVSQTTENENKVVLNTLSSVRRKAQEDYNKLENLVAQEEQKEKEEQEAKEKAEKEKAEEENKKAYLTPSTNTITTNTIISEETQQEIIEDFQESFTGDNLKEVNGELVYTDTSGEVHMSFNNDGYMDRMYTIYDCGSEEDVGTYKSMFEMFGFTVDVKDGTKLVIDMPLDGYEEMTKEDIIKAFNGEY